MKYEQKQIRVHFFNNSVKRNTYLPPSRASSTGKGVGLSIKPGRSTKTDKRKNSIGHTILIPTTRYQKILQNDKKIFG